MIINGRSDKKKKGLSCLWGLKKEKFNYYYLVVWLITLTIFIFPETSYAYLDPGTGSFVFQMIIAGLVGGLFTIKTFWRKIIGFFKKDNEK